MTTRRPYLARDIGWVLIAVSLSYIVMTLILGPSPVWIPAVIAVGGIAGTVIRHRRTDAR